MKLVLFILIFSTFNVFAQDKASNSDLRNQKEIFYIKELKANKKLTYRLESSVAGHFNLLTLDNKKIIVSRKIDTDDAQKLDDEFVDKFISFKYMMKPRKKNKCIDSYFLSLRGEHLTICSDEKEKIKIIELLITNLKKKFS